jgi:hypothetical protein
MEERKKYYERRALCQERPEMYYSTISDGMAQNHCSLPWHGSSGDQICEKQLGTKLQGVLSHGTPTARSKEHPDRKSRLTIYRSFANICLKEGKGQNIALYAWLSELEYEYKKRGRLPPVLYHQFDGGNENAGPLTIAVAEWLVLKGLTTRVVLTRLPVGHTHEDIDAQFAHIWKALRQQYVLSPQMQEILAIKGLGTKKQVRWRDVYCVPDFGAFFEGHIVPVSRAFKKNNLGDDWTQLQWIIQTKEDGTVYTSYRAYASDKVNEVSLYYHIPS